jgi:hypothetical protein
MLEAGAKPRSSVKRHSIEKHMQRMPQERANARRRSGVCLATPFPFWSLPFYAINCLMCDLHYYRPYAYTAFLFRKNARWLGTKQL